MNSKLLSLRERKANSDESNSKYKYLSYGKVYVPANLGEFFFLQVLLNEDTLFRVLVQKLLGRSVADLFWLLFSNQSYDSEKLDKINERRHKILLNYFYERSYEVKILIYLFMFLNLESFNPLSTKLYLSDLKTHFVPRSKHTLLRF